jgi:hypothetical protein
MELGTDMSTSPRYRFPGCFFGVSLPALSSVAVALTCVVSDTGVTRFNPKGRVKNDTL